MEEMERASRNLQCEASLVFVPPELADAHFLEGTGIRKTRPPILGVSAWQEAAAGIDPPRYYAVFQAAARRPCPTPDLTIPPPRALAPGVSRC